jgi:hypothetical protein
MTNQNCIAYFRMSSVQFNALLLKTENDITEQNSIYFDDTKTENFHYAVNIEQVEDVFFQRWLSLTYDGTNHKFAFVPGLLL